MSFDISAFDRYPKLQSILAEICRVWPEHAGYCESRFRNDQPAALSRSEEVADLVHRLADVHSITEHCADYRWMCERFLEEELIFRRTGKYRLATFRDAYEQVYSRHDYMSRYVRGILISQLVWHPHALAFEFFRSRFLALCPPGSRHLEIGPGHGLFLYFASQSPNITGLEAWDVSESSISATRSALTKLGVSMDVKLTLQDVLAASPATAPFDSAIISEVLEHLEHPERALATLRASLRPGGRLFINAPVNSPAPDHIYLWSSPDEFVTWVRAQDFEIEASEYYPVTGASLERAMRQKLSISCVVVARRPHFTS